MKIYFESKEDIKKFITEACYYATQYKEQGCPLDSKICS